jgi:Fe-S cluster biogenesis protein NfuA
MGTANAGRRLSMTNKTVSVEDVLGKMNAMVAADGGKITMRSYDPGAQVLEVDYTTQVNEDCPTCTVTGDMLKIFLTESLQSHGVPIDEVIVAES